MCVIKDNGKSGVFGVAQSSVGPGYLNSPVIQVAAERPTPRKRWRHGRRARHERHAARVARGDDSDAVGGWRAVWAPDVDAGQHFTRTQHVHRHADGSAARQQCGPGRCGRCDDEDEFGGLQDRSVALDTTPQKIIAACFVATFSLPLLTCAVLGENASLTWVTVPVPMARVTGCAPGTDAGCPSDVVMRTTSPVAAST